MILDSVQSFEKYNSIEEGFGKVYDYIRKTNLHSLAEGKYEIDGNNVYCTVWSGDLKPIEEAKLEVHDSYIDIQVLLEGSETIGIKDRMKCNAVGVDYDSLKDIAFFEEEPENYVVLGTDNMAIIFPADAHAPLLGSGKCKKVIFKVKINRKVKY
jgi:biofilm protein TabA